MATIDIQTTRTYSGEENNKSHRKWGAANEACEIEHSLMVQYLYASFSIKDRYPDVSGVNDPFSKEDSMMRIAVEEMQHLAAANELLTGIGGAPKMIRQDFPYEPAIYPFPFNLEPLTRTTTAKYVYTEAPIKAIDRSQNTNPGDQLFLDLLYGVLGEDCHPNRLGSLYGRIIDLIDELIADPAHRDKKRALSEGKISMEFVKGEGEEKHFEFFKRVFLSDPKLFNKEKNVWRYGKDHAKYPSRRLPVNPTALKGLPNQIKDADKLHLAWLSNLHYWIMLIFLDYYFRDLNTHSKARSIALTHMVGPFLFLGKHLASMDTGLPFDLLSMGYTPGKNNNSTLDVLRHFVLEAQKFREDLKSTGTLPANAGFPNDVYEESLRVIKELTEGTENETPSNGDEENNGGVEVMNRKPSFQLHIRPMFNETDIQHMSFRMELSDHEDVKNNSSGILSHLKGEGSLMPPESNGGPWPQEWIDLFERWINEGHPE